jgi:hypothetical protein
MQRASIGHSAQEEDARRRVMVRIILDKLADLNDASPHRIPIKPA